MEMFGSSVPIKGVDRREDRWKFQSKKDDDQGMGDRRARTIPRVCHNMLLYEMYEELSVMSDGGML